MKLVAAEFVFTTHKVCFAGERIFVHEATSGGWQLIDEHHNKWASKSKETDAVSGRTWKPNASDARAVLAMLLRQRDERKG